MHKPRETIYLRHNSNPNKRFILPPTGRKSYMRSPETYRVFLFIFFFFLTPNIITLENGNTLLHALSHSFQGSKPTTLKLYEVMLWQQINLVM